MASLNKVMLIGRLTGDPEEPRTLPNSGATVVKFRMAVGRGKKRDDGTWDNSDTMYIDCEVFSRPDTKRNLCDVVTRFLKRGSEAYVEGRLRLDEWEDRSGGGKRSKHKISVDSIELLGGKNGGNEDGEERQPVATASPGGEPDPELPFSWLVPLAAGAIGFLQATAFC